MLAIRWLYLQAAPADAWRDGGNALCWLCGAACPEGDPSQPVAKAVSDTFNDHALARCPSSDWLCPACAWYLSDSRAFRQASWLLSPTTATRWERETWRADLDTWFQGVAWPDGRILAITTSYKKHILLAARPCYGNGSLIIQFEQQTLILAAAEWHAMTQPFDKLRRMGHRKSEIVSGQLHPIALQRHQRIVEALELSRQLDAWRGSQALELLAHVSPAGDLEQKETGNGDGNLDPGGAALESGLGGRELGVQVEVSADRVGAVSVKGGHVQPDHERPGAVYQHSLWES